MLTAMFPQSSSGHMSVGPNTMLMPCVDIRFLREHVRILQGDNGSIIRENKRELWFRWLRLKQWDINSWVTKGGFSSQHQWPSQKQTSHCYRKMLDHFCTHSVDLLARLIFTLQWAPVENISYSSIGNSVYHLCTQLCVLKDTKMCPFTSCHTFSTGSQLRNIYWL
jgi:hypothetical protein